MEKKGTQGLTVIVVEITNNLCFDNHKSSNYIPYNKIHDI